MADFNDSVSGIRNYTYLTPNLRHPPYSKRRLEGSVPNVLKAFRSTRHLVEKILELLFDLRTGRVSMGTLQCCTDRLCRDVTLID
jgi:hypothetical protein